MPGLGPGIHEFVLGRRSREATFVATFLGFCTRRYEQLVDARAKPWHDDGVWRSVGDSVPRQGERHHRIR
jgi:hypothetical protein